MLRYLDTNPIDRQARRIYSTHIDELHSRVVLAAIAQMQGEGYYQPIMELSSTLLISNVRMRVPEYDMDLLIKYKAAREPETHDFMLTYTGSRSLYGGPFMVMNRAVLEDVKAKGLRGWSVLDVFQDDPNYKIDKAAFREENAKANAHLKSIVDAFFMARPAFNKLTPAKIMDQIFPEFAGAFSRGAGRD